MSVTPFVQYSYDSFSPVVGVPVVLPDNALLFRGYDVSYPAVTDVPAFFGPKDVANAYANLPNRKLGVYVARRPLRLYDVRYLMMLLQGVLVGRQNNPARAESAAIMEVMISLTISFGLSSLSKQVELVKVRFRDDLGKIASNIESMELFYRENCELPPELMDKSLHPFEPRGYRVAETTNDGVSLTFLKGFFRGHVDGFIAPAMFSPFHSEKRNCVMTPEILLFDPADASVELLTHVPTNVTVSSIRDILVTQNNFASLAFGGFKREWFHHRGGGKGKKWTSKKTCPNAFFDNVRACRPRESSLYARVLATAEAFKAAALDDNPMLFVSDYFRPHPTARVSSWKYTNVGS